jgi:hypothetical protein
MQDLATPKTRKDSGAKKMRQMLIDMFSMCKYLAEQFYEARKDVNGLLLNVSLSAQPLVPPPIFTFFPNPTSSDEEEEAQRDAPKDDEPLSARFQARPRRPRIAIRKTHTTPSKPHGKDAASEEEDVDDEDRGRRRHME